MFFDNLYYFILQSNMLRIRIILIKTDKIKKIGGGECLIDLRQCLFLITKYYNSVLVHMMKSFEIVRIFLDCVINTNKVLEEKNNEGVTYILIFSL
jgi:hypothetical protein